MSASDANRYVAEVGRCGRKLGRASSLYGTTSATADLAMILDAFGVDKIDLYGDSYGTFFGQVFALRYADRVRSIVMDSAYPAEEQDPWYPDWHDSAIDAVRTVCERDVYCSALPGSPVGRLRQMLKRVERQPIIGKAPDADGYRGKVVVNPDTLLATLTEAGNSLTIYRNMDAAFRAALAKKPDYRPLLRLVRPQMDEGGGSSRSFSYGLYYASICTDYPQLYDMTAPPAQRATQFAAAKHELRQSQPDIFAPFSIKQWVGSSVADYISCLRWPIPKVDAWPIPENPEYPNVPVLVLAGDLDSVTSPAGAAIVASRFPDSTLVPVANLNHVTALLDDPGCTSVIVRRFIRTLDAGDTSCAQDYPALRAVDTFARRTSDLPGSPRRQVALAAANAVADPISQWWDMYGWTGTGLRGGWFSTAGWHATTWDLHRIRWVQDLAVSGDATWNRKTGAITADVHLARADGSSRGHLKMNWSDNGPSPKAHVRGRIDGKRVHFTFLAP
jgi:pimeloyl-ACP methyl ester carboxylesterase